MVSGNVRRGVLPVHAPAVGVVPGGRDQDPRRSNVVFTSSWKTLDSRGSQGTDQRGGCSSPASALSSLWRWVVIVGNDVHKFSLCPLIFHKFKVFMMLNQAGWKGWFPIVLCFELTQFSLAHVYNCLFTHLEKYLKCVSDWPILHLEINT